MSNQDQGVKMDSRQAQLFHNERRTKPLTRSEVPDHLPLLDTPERRRAYLAEQHRGHDEEPRGVIGCTLAAAGAVRISNWRP